MKTIGVAMAAVGAIASGGIPLRMDAPAAMSDGEPVCGLPLTVRCLPDALNLLA